MDNTSYEAGKAQGTVQEKAKQAVDSVQKAGQATQTKAAEAATAAQKATGLKK